MGDVVPVGGGAVIRDVVKPTPEGRVVLMGQRAEIPYLHFTQVQEIFRVLQEAIDAVPDRGSVKYLNLLRDDAFIRTLWGTGARVSEALLIRYEDMDVMEYTIRLRTLKQRRKNRQNQLASTVQTLVVEGEEIDVAGKPVGVVYRENKGPRKRPPLRFVPVKPELLTTIQNYVLREIGAGRRDMGGPIFTFCRATGFNIVKHWVREAGLPDYHSPHSFRHGYGVHLTLNKVPVPVLKQYMGHADVNSTMVYTQIIAAHSRQFFDEVQF